jgi:hypothetical protein
VPSTLAQTCSLVALQTAYGQRARARRFRRAHASLCLLQRPRAGLHPRLNCTLPQSTEPASTSCMSAEKSIWQPKLCTSHYNLNSQRWQATGPWRPTKSNSAGGSFSASRRLRSQNSTVCTGTKYCTLLAFSVGLLPLYCFV